MILSIEALLLIAPAFVAGVIISFAHVPLGQEVLRRHIIFLDLAVAQFAVLGMLAFKILYDVPEDSYLDIYGGLAAGLIAALGCSVSFHFLEKISGQFQEALIGGAFVLAASLSILLVAQDPHGGEEIKNILAGQILWVNWEQVLMSIPVFFSVFLFWIFAQNKRRVLFYPLFAITIPFSVSMIGIYLVFSSLIFPALAVAALKKYALIGGLVISCLSYALGLMASYLFDWPSGPAIVVMMAIVSITFFTATKLRHQ